MHLIGQWVWQAVHDGDVHVVSLTLRGENRGGSGRRTDKERKEKQRNTWREKEVMRAG